MVSTMTLYTAMVLVLLSAFVAVQAFVPTSQQQQRSQTTTSLAATSHRRGFLSNAVGAAVGWSFLSSPALAEQAKETRQGIEVTAFNGLIFNYRGGDFGGLEADGVGEPSVSYADFNTRLKAGEVDFVEFLAPDGDKAYVTFKAEKAPIRIGEGYPVEKHDGYSSPMFCVRAVKNAGVPYKFTVPGLSKYSS